MARRNLENKLIYKTDIKEELRLIDESLTDYITPNGLVYVDYGNNFFYKKKTFVNKNNGYLYVNINTFDGKQKSRRVHILVAKAFLSNPNNYPIVMHKDNNKSNPRLDNLEWGTVSENTRNAYRDNLQKPLKGALNSNSIRVCVFDLNKNLIKICESVGEASRFSNITKSTILRQCNHQMKTKPRNNFYFRYFNEFQANNFIFPND